MSKPGPADTRHSGRKVSPLSTSCGPKRFLLSIIGYKLYLVNEHIIKSTARSVTYQIRVRLYRLRRFLDEVELAALIRPSKTAP
jgi:hypothetical protein